MATTLNSESVPTTKIVALGTVKAPLTPEQQRDIMSQEVPATLRLYLAGKDRPMVCPAGWQRSGLPSQLDLG